MIFFQEPGIKVYEFGSDLSDSMFLQAAIDSASYISGQRQTAGIRFGLRYGLFGRRHPDADRGGFIRHDASPDR
jgi:hypothetical protein